MCLLLYNIFGNKYGVLKQGKSSCLGHQEYNISYRDVHLALFDLGAVLLLKVA